MLKISDLNEEEIVGTFCKKEFEKSNQKEFTVEKAIKRKDDKLYVKWKEYHNSFNSCRDKKRHSINKPIFSRTETLRMKSKS